MRPKSDEPPTLLDAKALRQEQEAVEHEIASLNEQLEATRQAMAEARARRRRLARALLLVDGEATAVKKLGRLKPVLSPDPTPTAAAPTFLPETRRGEAGRKKGDSRKDVRRNAGRRNHKAPPYEAIRRALVDEVAKRVPQPLDAFEIAAVIESTGITDSVAREDYGTEDVFELAECIFPLVLRVNVSRGHVGHKPDDPHIAYREAEAGAIVEATGRGLLALAPLALLLVAMQSLAAAGWTAASLLALSFGVTAAMLLTSGPILAIGHRTAIYLGFRYRAPATRFLVLGSLATLCACAVAAAALLGGRALSVSSAHTSDWSSRGRSSPMGWSGCWLRVSRWWGRPSLPWLRSPSGSLVVSESVSWQAQPLASAQATRSWYWCSYLPGNAFISRTKRDLSDCQFLR